jgi:vacuolar protein sorting-associated protein 41
LLINNYEASKKYHGLLVGLYADFSPDKLMSFLKSSDHYPIQNALEACEVRGLTPERIFILARMGSTRQALHLITRELADIHRAVDFCKEYDDVDLWNDLVSVLLNFYVRP